MKICYIAQGISIHAQRWVNYFARKGHEVHIISNSIREGYSKSVQVHLLTTPLPKPSLISGYINMLVWIVQTRQLINRIKPDIIDAHYITIYGYLAIASGFHPLVLTAWGSDILIDPKKKRLYRLLTKYALRKAEVITCNSETLRKELLNLGANSTRIKKIYNGIDTSKFKPQPSKEFKNRLGLQGAPVIISTRNFKPVYNVEMLIRAIPLILEQVPQVRFLLAGDGVQREYLENLATTLGVSKNISFVGWIPHDKLPQHLTSSDIYVSTSLSDSASLSLQEAMACELAPVVTDLSGNREWINDGENGFLVPIGNQQALAERIIYLIENKDVRERFGKKGRRIIVERAEYGEEMSKMEKIYEGQVESNKL